ncbi:MAG: hypothetical protein HQL97_00915 [Magnetococcales bacterium]|nr:hypothetical protein [Magnetococcales bacterium]
MSTTIQISDTLAAEARQHAQVFQRSLPGQIEFWSSIGKIAEENPDLNYAIIKDILLARQETELQEYQLG